MNYAAHSVSAVLASLVLTAPATAGRVVLAHDVNTLASQFAGPSEQQFAVNVANYLTGGGGALLLIESSPDPYRNFDQEVVTALTSAGFNVTADVVADGYASEIGSLSSYDAVFFGIEYGTYHISPVELITSFVDSGGGIYVLGGNGDSPVLEAQALDPVVSEYGLAFIDEYNCISVSSVIVSGTNPILCGLVGEGLGCWGGNNIIDTDPSDRRGAIVQTQDGLGVYAVWDPDLLADLNGNGAVDFADVFILIGAWGDCAGCPADLNGSGDVDFADLLQLLGAWNACGAI